VPEPEPQIGPDTYLVIPNWDKFQHYKDRDPRWIKVYGDLLDRAEFQELSTATRGLLLTIWLQYARTSGQVKLRVLQTLNGRGVGRPHFISLYHAGFIEFSASKPLAIRTIELEKEKKLNKERPLALVRTAKRVELHQALLTHATELAQSWLGKDSAAFNERLDELEREHRSRFSDGERIALTATAFDE
jgi:hypothetical protein